MRRLGRSGLRAAAAVAAAAIAAGASASTAMSRPTETTTAAACPHRAPTSLSPERWAAAHHQLAPSGLSTIRLCRYSGSNAHPRLTLASSRLLKRPALVRQLVSEFDRLPSLRGVVACPDDDLSQILALLVYPGGRELTISVGLTGCETVTNGGLRRTAAGMGSPPAFGPQLVARLERLIDERLARDGNLRGYDR